MKYLYYLVFVLVFSGCDKSSDIYAKTKAIYHLAEEGGSVVLDAKGGRHAEAFNVETINGCFDRAKKYNGKDLCTKTPLNFNGWKQLTISLWVKPEAGSFIEYSVILDNGHSEDNNYVLQSVPHTQNNSIRIYFVWH